MVFYKNIPVLRFLEFSYKLVVCHNLRIKRNHVFKGWAGHGKALQAGFIFQN